MNFLSFILFTYLNMRQTLFVGVVIRIFGEWLGNCQIGQRNLSFFQTAGDSLQLLVYVSDPIVATAVAEDLVEDVLA